MVEWGEPEELAVLVAIPPDIWDEDIEEFVMPDAKYVVRKLIREYNGHLIPWPHQPLAGPHFEMSFLDTSDIPDIYSGHLIPERVAKVTTYAIREAFFLKEENN